MIFNTPIKLNGTRLISELAAVDINIDTVLVNGLGELVLDIADKDKAKAEQVIANHKGEDSPDPKATARASALAKLAALGLSADEIAAL